jgi:hypothetical protein
VSGVPARLARLEARFGLAGPCPCHAEWRVLGFDEDLVPPLPETCERCGRRRPTVEVVIPADGPR